ncbi:DUF905 domain-containing protein [Klebsiella oxytoca]|uniref:DUF905 domain-containing protein n=1 Tax=Klebsiella oxytoca TaxID=571 RepID=UPI0021CBA5F7|nr:DUF905 domain-containing protein [Klebsiella oxytoca]
MLCHGTVCVVGKMRDLILQLSKSSIYSTKPRHECRMVWRAWNFESDAGYWLNRYITRDGIRKFPA